MTKKIKYSTQLIVFTCGPAFTDQRRVEGDTSSCRTQPCTSRPRHISTHEFGSFEDTGEDPHHQKPNKCTVEHTHKTIFPPSDEAEHDTPITYRLIGAYRYDTCMNLFPYAPRRRWHGVGRGQLLTDPSPGTMTRIRSPFPTLVTSCPTPFKFAQEPCFLFFPACNAGKQQIAHYTNTVRH